MKKMKLIISMIFLGLIFNEYSYGMDFIIGIGIFKANSGGKWNDTVKYEYKLYSQKLDNNSLNGPAVCLGARNYFLDHYAISYGFDMTYFYATGVLNGDRYVHWEVEGPILTLSLYSGISYYFKPFKVNDHSRSSAFITFNINYSDRLVNGDLQEYFFVNEIPKSSNFPALAPEIWIFKTI